MSSVRPKFNYRTRPAFAEEALLAAVWALFEALFATEEACLRELLSKNGEDVFRCRYCCSKDVNEESGGRSIKCKKCRKRTWLTASTFFDHIRHPRAWLAAIWLREHGVSISAARFQRLVGGIAYSTASDIFKKLEFVIASEMENCNLKAPTAHFCEAICKRSLVTPARKHPFAEEAEFEKRSDKGGGDHSGHSARTASSTSSRPSAACGVHSANPDSPPEPISASGEPAGAEREIYDALSVEPLDFDTLLDRTGIAADEFLPAITMLELQGLAASVGGSRYVRLEKVREVSANADTSPLSGFEKSIIECCIEFVKRKFHGVSRKYLQFYLAEYWCYVDRNRWSLKSLLRTCQQFCYICSKEIRNYESPLVVKLCPSP
jgi:DprA winged helix domain